MDRPCSNNHCQACPTSYLCRCLKVTESQLVEAIENHQLQTLREIRRHTGAGDGCTCCHAKINAVLEKYSLVAVGS